MQRTQVPTAKGNRNTAFNIIKLQGRNQKEEDEGRGRRKKRKEEEGKGTRLKPGKENALYNGDDPVTVLSRPLLPGGEQPVDNHSITGLLQQHRAQREAFNKHGLNEVPD